MRSQKLPLSKHSKTHSKTLATLRFVCCIQHMCGCTALPGLVDIAYKLSRDDLREGQILLLISLTSIEENVLKVGRVEETKVEKWAEESLPSL